MQPYHIFPDEMMKELPGYVSEEAPAVALSEDVSYVANQTLEKSVAYCRSVGVTLLTFKDVFTIVAGSLLLAGIPRDDMQQIGLGEIIIRRESMPHIDLTISDSVREGSRE